MWLLPLKEGPNENDMKFLDNMKNLRRVKQINKAIAATWNFKQKLPSAKPLKKSIKPRYLEFIKPLKVQLDSISFPEKPPIWTEIVAQN